MRVAAVVGPPAVPAGPALGFNTHQVLTLPQQRLLNNWTHCTLALVASKVPDTVAPIVTSINNLRQDLTTINADRQDEEEEKARIAALPQTFAKRSGTPVCEEVMQYVEVDSMDDLPLLLKTLGSHTKQVSDHVAIRSAIDIRANKNNCVANQWSKPVVTALLLVIFREHRLTATGDNYGEGFTPFTITCAGHPNVKDEVAKANQLNPVETGSTGISYADTVAFEKVDQRLPTDNHQCTEKLQGHSVAIDLHLGVDHHYSVAYRQHLADLAPFVISGLRDIYCTEGNALLLACLHIMYWHQQEFFYYLDLLQKGTANPPLPKFDKLLKALRIKNHESYLPTLPKSWVTLAKPGAKRLGKGNAGGGEGVAKKKTKVVTNPDVNPGLKRRFKESGHKNINVCLKVGQDAGVALILPKIGGKEACLNWLATEFCKEDFKRVDTVQALSSTTSLSVHSPSSRSSIVITSSGTRDNATLFSSSELNSGSSCNMS